MIKELRDFLFKANVLDLAVAVIVGLLLMPSSLHSLKM